MRKWREASMIPARLIAGSATVQRGPWRMRAETRQEKDFSRHVPAIRLDFLTFACMGFQVLSPGGYSMVSHCQHQCDISVSSGVVGTEPLCVPLLLGTSQLEDRCAQRVHSRPESCQELLVVKKQLATALRRVRRRNLAEDMGGLGFTKRMRLVTTSIFIQSESKDCAEAYLVQALRRKLPPAQRLVEDWVLQTSDDTMLSVSVTPNSGAHWRIHAQACLWIAEWRAAQWVREQTCARMPRSGIDLIRKYMSLLPDWLQQEALLDTRRALAQGSLRLNARYRQWCVRFKKRHRVRRALLQDTDPMTPDEAAGRVPRRP